MANNGIFYVPAIGSVSKLFTKTIKAVLKQGKPCKTLQLQKEQESRMPSAHKSQQQSAHKPQLQKAHEQQQLQSTHVPQLSHIESHLEQLMEQQLKLNTEHKLLKRKVNLLKRRTHICRRRTHKRTSPLAGLSAELKFRLAEQVRKTSPNHLLWLREWFFGPTSLAGAEWLLLANKRNKPGAFLLCERSGKHKREFVLSVLLSPQSDDSSAASGALVNHYRVRPYHGYRIASDRAFRSLQDLIDYYSEEKREGCVQLVRACAMPRTREYARL
jgi:hypothetical protein